MEHSWRVLDPLHWMVLDCRWQRGPKWCLKLQLNPKNSKVGENIRWHVYQSILMNKFGVKHLCTIFRSCTLSLVHFVIQFVVNSTVGDGVEQREWFCGPLTSSFFFQKNIDIGSNRSWQNFTRKSNLFWKHFILFLKRFQMKVVGLADVQWWHIVLR